MRYLRLLLSEVVLLEDCIKQQRAPGQAWLPFSEEYGDVLLRLGGEMCAGNETCEIGFEERELWLLVLAVRSTMMVGGVPVGLELLNKCYRELVACRTERFVGVITDEYGTADECADRCAGQGAGTEPGGDADAGPQGEAG